MAFKNAAYCLESGFAKGLFCGRGTLYAWESKPSGENVQPKGLKLIIRDPVKLSKAIKEGATLKRVYWFVVFNGKMARGYASSRRRELRERLRSPLAEEGSEMTGHDTRSRGEIPGKCKI